MAPFMDARQWLASQYSSVAITSTIVNTLLKRRVMRFRRGEIKVNPLHYLHDHCELGPHCGKDQHGNETLYPRACITVYFMRFSLTC